MIDRTEAQIESLKKGPCQCTCHDDPKVWDRVPCCGYTYQPRAEAEAEARDWRGENE